MTMPKDLRAKAEAATRGPWTHEIEGDAVIIMAYDDCEYHEIAKLESNRSCRELCDDEDNASYIAAASPDVVISLLDEIERLREALRPFAGLADANEECGREDPDDDRIWILQAYGCKLAELDDEDLRRASAVLATGDRS